MAKYLGRHLIVEIYGADPEKLNDLEYLRTLFRRATSAAKATPVREMFHQFSPYGVTGVIVVEESHLTIHTWPEHGYAAVDVFTCGDDVEPEGAAMLIVEELEAENYSIIETNRGNLHIADKSRRKFPFEAVVPGEL